MGESILVVDDEKPVLQMVSRLIESLGHTAVTAESAEQALEVAARTPVDLVITDLKMPGMDGLELAQRLLEEDPDRPVLLMTAYADLDSARQAVGIGIYEYFTKPFDVNDVVAGVKRALERRRLVLENRAYQKDLERKVEERTRELQQSLQELRARDELLRHLLSIQDPEETLGLAIKLALDLCGCDAGALYVPDASGEVKVRTAVGFLEVGVQVKREDLCGLELGVTVEAAQALQETVRNRTPVWVHNPGAVRQGAGIHSFGVVPVCRGEEVVAILEVDRKRKDALVGEADLEALQGFLPYVAMAVGDCKLQEDFPGWEGDVEDILKETEKWTE